MDNSLNDDSSQARYSTLYIVLQPAKYSVGSLNSEIKATSMLFVVSPKNRGIKVTIRAGL